VGGDEGGTPRSPAIDAMVRSRPWHESGLREHHGREGSPSPPLPPPPCWPSLAPRAHLRRITRSAWRTTRPRVPWTRIASSCPWATSVLAPRVRTTRSTRAASRSTSATFSRARGAISGTRASPVRHVRSRHRSHAAWGSAPSPRPRRMAAWSELGRSSARSARFMGFTSSAVTARRGRAASPARRGPRDPAACPRTG